MKVDHRIIAITVLMMTSALVCAQQTQNPPLSIGENTKLNAGALLSVGYSGDYGDVIQSDHGLTFGFDGKISGYYYNPNFLSFTADPYYNQSRANSSYQSLTGATGFNSTVNFFTGSRFPGSASYRFDRNSTGTFGLAGQPNFTTIGKGQGFAINWSALMPNLPTLSVGYSQGDGSGTIYGTSEQTTSNTKLFNARSSYEIEAFRLNAFYDQNNLNSKFPEFLSGASESLQHSSGHDTGVGAQHPLPWHGQAYANYERTWADTSYLLTSGGDSNSSSYVNDVVNAGASLHPTTKLTLNLTENYTSNLNGYVAQTLTTTGTPQAGINFGTGAHSSTIGGGGTYQFTNFLSTTAQATYYDQEYFGKNFTGTYVSGTVNYGKRLLDMLTFSGSVIDSSNGQGTNNLGFIGNVNFFHRIKGWQVAGVFSYAQNVQTILVTYTSSYYNYSANLHRRLPLGYQWTASFNGTHSGLTNYQGTSSQSKTYSTAFGSRQFTLTGNYSQAEGVSLLGASGLVPVTATPGISNFLTFNGTSYGGGVSLTPIRRMVLAGSFSRAISDTIAETISHNNTEIFNAQLQYHFRRVGLQAGYTRFTQGISAVGAPANTTSYFVGLTRWFDFF